MDTEISTPQWYACSSDDEGSSSPSSNDDDDEEVYDEIWDNQKPPVFQTSSGTDFAPESPLKPTPDQSNITINVKIEDWSTKIFCGAGNQSLKWLCLAAVERYRLERTQNGKVRARENNKPLRRRRPDEDSKYSPLRGIRGSHVPMDIKLKKSFKKVGHHLIRLKLLNKIKAEKTADFFKNSSNVTAAAARRATMKANMSKISYNGLINKNFQQNTAKPDLGLHDCYELKKQGRGGDGNRIPDTYEPLRYHLENEDTITILLDEFGGKYIARNNSCSVSSFMRLRYVQRRQHLGIKEPEEDKNDKNDKDNMKYIPTYVTKRGIHDRNTEKQVKENVSRLSLFKFIKNKEEHHEMKKMFSDPETYDILRRLFRDYAFGDQGDAFSMDGGEWEQMCKDAGLLNVKNMTYGKIDTVFIAANYTAKAANKEALLKSIEKGGKRHVSNNPDNAFTLHEFIEGICRLGIILYDEKDQNEKGEAMTNVEKVRALLDLYLIPLARSISGNWDIFEDIESDLVQVEYHNRMAELESKFTKYVYRKKKNIKNMFLTLDDYTRLIESTGLLTSADVLVNASATYRMVRECFVWSQRKSTDEHSSVSHEEESLARMDFKEFLESLALMAHRIFSSHDKFKHATGSHAEHLSQQLSEFLDILIAKRRDGVDKTESNKK
jgi:hypothetical protein